MTEEEAKRLLAEAVHAGEMAERSREKAVADAAARRAAIQACMDAGIPRQQIADALGVARTSLYRILADT